MIFDTHMHCRYSIDSKMNIDEAKAAAEKLGIGMIITEHWDEDYPTNPEAFVFDIGDYFAKCGPYHSKKLLLGIEVGMQESTAANDDALGKKYPFDFILGSMHCMNGRDMYEAKTYNGKTKQEAVREFLLATAENLKLHDNFDSFAHIDYMCRYMPYEDKELVYAEAPELFDAVFWLKRIRRLKLTRGVWITRQRLSICLFCTSVTANWAGVTQRWAATRTIRNMWGGDWILPGKWQRQPDWCRCILNNEKCKG